MNEWHETEIRVRYAETDKMGIVHHSNYLVWFEFGRSEFCRSRGFSYLEMEEKDNALMVVAEVYCRYKSPAHYEDLVTVRTRIADVRSRSLRFIYEIHRASDQKLLAEGETLHVVTDENKKVRSLPQGYKEKLLADEVPEENSFPEDYAPSWKISALFTFGFHSVKLPYMQFTSLAEAYFIGVMMILILIVSFAAVFFFFRQLKREKAAAAKLKQLKELKNTNKENVSN